MSSYSFEVEMNAASSKLNFELLSQSLLRLARYFWYVTSVVSGLQMDYQGKRKNQ